MFAINFSMEKRIKIFWIAGFFLPAINATVFRSWHVKIKKLISTYLANPFFIHRRLQIVSTAHNPYCLGVTKLSLQSQSVKSALQTPDSLPMAWQALLQKSWLILHFDGIKALMLSVISQLSKKKRFIYLSGLLTSSSYQTSKLRILFSRFFFSNISLFKGDSD